MTVLVVDDIPANLQLATVILEGAGYAVLTASGAADALERATEGKPALALVDLHMPGLDGFALVRLLRSTPATAALPVVLMTAYIDAALEHEALALGCQAYITKPISRTAFLAVVARWAAP